MTVLQEVYVDPVFGRVTVTFWVPSTETAICRPTSQAATRKVAG